MKWLKRIFILGIIIGIIIGIMLFQRDIPLEELQKKYGTPPSQFMTIQKMPVHFRDEGTGMPVVLLHGTSSSLFTWDTWTEILKKDFRVIRVDMPGFGLTGPNPRGNYSIDMYTSVLKTLLDSLQIDSCAIAGNSLGGYVAWNFAVKYPRMTKKLILLDAVAYSEALPDVPVKVADKRNSLAFRLAMNPATAWIVRWLTPRSLLKSSLEEVYYNDALVTDSLVDLYFDMVRREGNRQAFIDNVNTRKTEGTEELLPSLQQPVLIQWGKDDQWVDISMAEWFHAVLPNDTMIIYENAGHIPMEELPEETARDAARFLKQD